MGPSYSQRAALALCILAVAIVLFVRAKAINYRIDRAGRLFDAGRIREGDRTMAAVQRAVARFYKAHPGWARPINTGASA